MENMNYEERENYIRKVVDSYGHDAFFHYLVSKHDAIRLIFCQKMVKEYKIIETTVIKSEYYPSHNQGKKFVLDILAKDDQGHLYNIEMQCYMIDDEEMIRFQLYAHRVLSDEAKKGISNKEVKPLRQMIINTSKPLEGLNQYIHHFVMYDIENEVRLPNSLYEVYLVQLAYLNMEEIKIEAFDELMYLFKNNQAYDKIEVHKNVVEAMTMHEEYMNSAQRLGAIQRERDEMARRMKAEREMREAKKIGRAEGRAEGLAEGRAEGKTEGRIEGLVQGEIKAKQETIMHLYVKKLGSLSNDIQDKIRELNIEKLDELILSVFDIESEDELKKLV